MKQLGCYQTRDHWKQNIQKVPRDAFLVGLWGSMDFKLLSSQRTAITVKNATPVGIVN